VRPDRSAQSVPNQAQEDVVFDLLIVLLPILVADIVNPVLFAFLVYAVGTDRPLGNSLAALFGHTATYLGFGILLAAFFDAIMVRLENPEPIDFGISLVIGLLLLGVAWRSVTASGSTGQKQPVGLTPTKAFLIGSFINLIGLPFALPYFAALDQMLAAELSVTHSVMMVVGYNLAYAMPFLIVPLLAGLMGEASRPILERINDRVDNVSAFLMPVMLGLIGAALVADAFSYFVYGEGLI
jgi:cytochrome c biogenesis protein CcdA